MTPWEILLISFGVSIDALAVSVAASLADRGDRFRHGAMAALYFGGFQTLMPLAGFGTACIFHSFVAAVDHCLAFALLGFVGGRMIFEALRGGGEPHSLPRAGFFTWRKLLIPAVATSLDALAVGAGLAFSGSAIWIPAFAMGAVTGAVSFAGVLLGRRIGGLAGERPMQLAGGAAIVLIGIKILIADLCGTPLR